MMQSSTKHWHQFLSKLTAIYIAATSVGFLTAVLTCLLIGQFHVRELRLTIVISIVLMLIAAAVQIFSDRRWLFGLRRYLTHEQSTPELQARVYAELIRYPWRGSLLGLLTWQCCAIVYFVCRLFLMPDVPVYRHAFILAILSGAALLNWTIHYFLLRRITLPLLEGLKISREKAMAVPRRALSRKYFYAMSSLLLGVVILGGMIAYGINRNMAVAHYYKQVRDLLVMAELLLYEFDYGVGLDIQTKLAEFNHKIAGKIEIVPRPDPLAMDVAAIDKARSTWFIFPVYAYEIQALPERMLFYRKLSFAGNRNSKIYLQYVGQTASLRRQLRETAILLVSLGGFLLLLMSLSTLTSVQSLSRPIRVLGAELHPDGDDFSAPPLLISDDELMSFSVGLRAMFLRLQHLFQELLQAYWSVKDERAAMQNIATKFQQRSHRDSQHIQLLTNRLRELTDQVQGFGQQLEAMDKVADAVGQSLRLMNDTVTAMQNEMASVRARIVEAKDWLQQSADDVAAGERAMAGLDRWIADATQEFDLVLRRFQELLHALEPADRLLVSFTDNVQAGVDHVQTVHLLLTNETDRYTQGVGLIQATQDRLDEVMRRFEEIETIREQIDMLSFQAAIVASQSLDYERDFRVVADEIRDLSERAAAGIQQIFTAIWALDQQGKQTIQRIAKSRQALAEALSTSQRAHIDAQQGLNYSQVFTQDMHKVFDVVRTESRRTETLVDSLKEPFMRGAHLRTQVARIFELYQGVDLQVRRLDQASRSVESRIREQQEALRFSRLSIDRIGLQIRELISAGEGIVMQSRTLRSILERLNEETQQTSARIDATLADLRKIEEEIFRNEAEVKRVSAELQST